MSARGDFGCPRQEEHRESGPLAAGEEVGLFLGLERQDSLLEGLGKLQARKFFSPTGSERHH
jgi:hypothetical protein